MLPAPVCQRLGPTDGLKAAEMLTKMCGYNEPERVDVNKVELRVDAALLEQLRAGAAETNKPKQLTASVMETVDGAAAANSEANGAP
jgi:hypothetical protein